VLVCCPLLLLYWYSFKLA